MIWNKQMIAILDRLAKDYQKMPEGDEKKLMYAEMVRIINRIYGS